MEKLSAENDQKLSKAILLLDEIVVVGSSALKKFPTNGYEPFAFIFINYLERFTNSIEHINILLKSYKAKPNVETSIGLILRASLLDFITIAYLSTYYSDSQSESNNDKFEQKFDGFISDQINHIIKYIKLYKDVGHFKEAEYKQAIDNIWTRFEFVFTDAIVDYESPEKKLVSRDHKSPVEMFKRLCNHSLTKNDVHAYDLYSYYSKYEHFGIMTHFLQRQGINKDFNTMVSGLDYVIRGLGLSLTYLSLYPVEDEKTKFAVLKKQYLDEVLL